MKALNLSQIFFNNCYIEQTIIGNCVGKLHYTSAIVSAYPDTDTEGVEVILCSINFYLNHTGLILEKTG